MVHILTFHRALNYGAILQCYALYRTINKFVTCDVIDYQSSAISARYALFNKKMTIKGFLRNLLLYKNTKDKKRKFSAFLKNNIHMTPSYHSFEQLQKVKWDKDDIFVVGSDQVWNWELTNDDSAFFLEFVPSQNKKVSYAASFGFNLTQEHDELLHRRLEGYYFISLREKSAYESVKKYGITCTQCIDPVFLLDKAEWEKITCPVVNEDEKYVLIYMLQQSKHFINAALKFAKQAGYKVIMIPVGARRSYSIEYAEGCGPEEFLRYFLKADVIFTNSFHGIALSILFEKEFYFEFQGNFVNTNGRINDIVEMFDLMDRNITGKDSIYSIQLDHKKVHKAIEINRGKSLDYIRMFCNI